MGGFWPWATTNWFLGFVLMLVFLAGLISIISRLLRTIHILVRGWPKSPIMDADGDIIYPKSGDDD